MRHPAKSTQTGANIEAELQASHATITLPNREESYTHLFLLHLQDNTGSNNLSSEHTPNSHLTNPKHQNDLIFMTCKTTRCSVFPVSDWKIWHGEGVFVQFIHHFCPLAIHAGIAITSARPYHLTWGCHSDLSHSKYNPYKTVFFFLCWALPVDILALPVFTENTNVWLSNITMIIEWNTCLSTA